MHIKNKKSGKKYHATSDEKNAKATILISEKGRFQSNKN